MIDTVMSNHPDFGRRTGNYKRIRELFRADCERLNMVCWICRKPILYDLPANHPEAFHADHRQPRSLRPDLAEEISNLAPAHADCNRRRGNDTSGPIDIGIPSERW